MLLRFTLQLNSQQSKRQWYSLQENSPQHPRKPSIFAWSSYNLGWALPWFPLTESITNTTAAKIWTRVSNWWVRIGFPRQPGCVLPFWKRQDPSKPKNLPRHLSRWQSSSVQRKEKRTRDKILVSGVSANSGQGGGKPTHTTHCVNMDKWYKPSPTCAVGQVSSREERQFPIPRYENDLIPGGGPVI